MIVKENGFIFRDPIFFHLIYVPSFIHSFVCSFLFLLMIILLLRLVWFLLAVVFVVNFSMTSFFRWFVHLLLVLYQYMCVCVCHIQCTLYYFGFKWLCVNTTHACSLARSLTFMFLYIHRNVYIIFCYINAILKSS